MFRAAGLRMWSSQCLFAMPTLQVKSWAISACGEFTRTATNPPSQHSAALTLGNPSMATAAVPCALRKHLLLLFVPYLKKWHTSLLSESLPEVFTQFLPRFQQWEHAQTIIFLHPGPTRTRHSKYVRISWADFYIRRPYRCRFGHPWRPSFGTKTLTFLWRYMTFLEAHQMEAH